MLFAWEEIFEQPCLDFTNNEELVTIKFSDKNQNVLIENNATLVHSSGGKGYGIIDCNINDLTKNFAYFEWKVYIKFIISYIFSDSCINSCVNSWVNSWVNSAISFVERIHFYNVL